MCVFSSGFNPVWEETLSFTLHMAEVVLVRFLVWDHDPIGRDFIGQRTVAFSSLMPGLCCLFPINLCLVNHNLFDLLNKRPVAWQVIFAVHIHQSCPWICDALSLGNCYSTTSLMTAVIFLWLIIHSVDHMLSPFFSNNRLQTCLPGGADWGFHLCACVSAWCLWEGKSCIVLLLVVAFPFVLWDYILEVNKIKVSPFKMCSLIPFSF